MFCRARSLVKFSTKYRMAEQQILSISQLAFRFELDRATVRKRLQKAEIKPHSEREKEKLYLLTPELEQVLAETNDGLDATKLRKLDAEADLKEIEVQKRRGELVSVADFIEAVQTIFGAMHKQCVIKKPKQIAKKLLKAKDENQVVEILTGEYATIFDNLRSNHQEFLQ